MFFGEYWLIIASDGYLTLQNYFEFISLSIEVNPYMISFLAQKNKHSTPGFQKAGMAFIDMIAGQEGRMVAEEFKADST